MPKTAQYAYNVDASTDKFEIRVGNMENTTLLHARESNNEANKFTLMAEGQWLFSILHNGEQLVETQRENIRRLVACWNACQGISTEWLESSKSIVLLAEPISDRFKALNAENAELAAALEAMVADFGVDGHGAPFEDGECSVVDKSRAALTKHKGATA